jgi:hypothetical protein
MTKETQQQVDKPVQDGKRKRTVEIKPTQVLATALAAVTAAFLGSRLGVAGTVTGAGVASVVSTLGGALYQSSLDHTSRRVAKVAEVAKVRTARRGRFSSSAEAAAAALRDQKQLDQPQPGRPQLDRATIAAPPTSAQRVVSSRTDTARVGAAGRAEPATEVMGAWAPTRRFEPVRRPDPIADATTDWLSKPTEIVGAAGVFHRPTDVADRPSGVFSRPANAIATNATAAADGPTNGATQPALVGPPPGNQRRRRLLMAGGATVLAFVLGMGVVTGIELLDDQPLSGGNTGTTIGSLFGGSTQQSTDYSVAPTTETATPTTTPSAPSTSASTTPTTTSGPETTTPSSSTTGQSTTTGAPATSPVTPTGNVGAP